jgi:4'-phosphopantetheinyl transferase
MRFATTEPQEPEPMKRVLFRHGHAGLSAGAPPAFLRDGVHLWRLALDGAASAPTLLPLLCAEERVRADRFHFARDRYRFIVTRGALRCILAHYLDLAPQDVRFRYGSHGKPALDPAQNGADLRFNLSHTDGLALLAVAPGRELGVDVERIRKGIAQEEIAERFFARAEVADLRALPADSQDDAFYACWTRKEAYLKARGEGLSIPLDQFTVTLVPGEPAALLHVVLDPEEVKRWSLHDLDAGPGYRAALLVEGHDPKLFWREPRFDAGQDQAARPRGAHFPEASEH